jgi:hypothetical protein
VATFPEVLGPVVEEHALVPPVPEIDQLSVPVGAAELLAPVTVVVKVIVPPRVGDPEAMSTTVGVACDTVVELVEAIDETAL